MPDGQETVFVVDDDEAVRRSLARLLRSAGLAVESFASVGELLARDPYDGVGCIVLDVRMPELDGMELQTALAERNVDLPIVFLTGHGDIPTSVRAIKKGAFDFLTKPVDEEVLLAAVNEALERHRVDRSERQEVEALLARLDSLTPRELEVLRCVITGALNKQIAACLGIAEKTVKIHRGQVMRKLGTKTVAGLIQSCQRIGVEPRSDALPQWDPAKLESAVKLRLAAKQCPRRHSRADRRGTDRSRLPVLPMSCGPTESALIPLATLAARWMGRTKVLYALTPHRARLFSCDTKRGSYP